MKTKVFAMLIAAMLVITGCSNDDLTGGNKISNVLNAPKYTNTISFTADEQSANEAINKFSQNLFNSIFTDKNLSGELLNNDNFSYSPLSTALCLSLAANTSNDTQSAQIAKVMNCDDVETMTSVCNKLLLYLPHTDNGAELLFGNSVWFNSDYTVSSDYVKRINTLFNAEVYNVNFDDNATVNLINSWVSQKTNNKIDNLLNNTNDLDALLCNTMYFMGEWSTKFTKSKTISDSFHGTNGEESAKLMTDTRIQSFFELEDCSAVSFTFKKEKTEMIFVLPNENVNIDTFTKSFNNDKYTQLLDSRFTASVTSYVPRFTIEHAMFLTSALSKMGLPSSITLTKAGINASLYCEVKQKTYTSIDEDGVILAAATSLGGITSTGGEMGYENRTIRLDRPFLYIVRNINTGSILMEGRICNL